MKSPIAGGPSLLFALPPGAVAGDWLDRWRVVLDAGPGDRRVLDPDPHYVSSWRRRAIEHCGDCWTVLPDPGSVPGVPAFSLALRAMVEDPHVACVSIVPADAVSCMPEIRTASPPFYSARFALGGVLLVKAPLATKEALPEPRFHPYDFAEASFRMTSKGLRVLVLPDPSFIEQEQGLPFQAKLRRAWREGRGGVAFRLAHKGRAPRSLRIPRSRLELLLLGPWLIPSAALRMARTSPARVDGSKGALRALDALGQSAALWAGALAGYSVK